MSRQGPTRSSGCPAPAMPAQVPFPKFESRLHKERKHRGRDGARHQQDVIIQREPGRDAFPVAAGADEGGYGGRAHADDGCCLDTGQQHRHR